MFANASIEINYPASNEAVTGIVLRMAEVRINVPIYSDRQTYLFSGQLPDVMKEIMQILQSGSMPVPKEGI